MPITQDPFWNVREREEAEERHWRQVCDRLEREINLGKRALALRHSPGFEDFIKAVEGCRESAIRKTLMESTFGDVRYAQGQTRALTDVLTLLTKSDDSVQALASQLKEAQNRLEQFRRPKPQPTGA